MLGRATAILEPIPRRWLQRAWGYPDIHIRQKWMALWPHLARLSRQNVRLLDAGCGRGRWALELAARRPQWQVVGVDVDRQAVEAAEHARCRLGLSNVAFVHSDFLTFHPAKSFDVVLSVASAHYLAEAGKGEELFRQFQAWLKPGGLLFLLAPRQLHEAPFIRWLPYPAWHPVFSSDDLTRLCDAGGLLIELLCGQIGRSGTLAKQLDWLASGPLRPVLLAAGVYSVNWMLTHIDMRSTRCSEQNTLMWLLIARTTP